MKAKTNHIMNSINSFDRLIAFLLIFFAGSCFLLADQTVKSYSETLKVLLLDGQDSVAQQMLNTPSGSDSIDFFNEALNPFFKLFMESDPKTSLELYQNFRRQYGPLVDLSDYSGHYQGMRETFFNAEEHEHVSVRELYTQPLPGPKKSIALVDVTLLTVLSVTNRASRISQNHLNNLIEQKEPEMVAEPSKLVESTEDYGGEIMPEPDIENTKEPASAQKNEQGSSIVVATKPSTESAEKASQWWLWIISFVVLFGGIAVIFRPKR